MYNILILSAGRRVELISCFKAAAKRMLIDSKLIAADASKLAPALYYADKKFIIPCISSPNYIESIINICLDENISLIVPTIDTELMILSKNKKYIEKITGAKVLISSPNIIEICSDKIKSHKFFEENNFKTAKLFNESEIREGNVEFPAFIKPIDGSSSINAYKVNSMKELEAYYNLISEPMLQEFIEGDEYTVDVFLDFESNVITVVPRLRIATRSGEILKGKIVKDKEIIKDVKRLMNILKPIGHVSVQCIKSRDGIKYIEINPRFGGGAPMSIMAGANSPENLYRILRSETLEYNENYKDNIIFLRYDSCIIIDEKLTVQ